MSLLRLICFCLLLGLPGAAMAEDPFGVAGRADGSSLALDFSVAEGYHLYRDQISVSAGGTVFAVDLPEGEVTDDPTFGVTEIYRRPMTARVTASFPAAGVTVAFQGCDETGICLPPQTRHVDTALLGLPLLDESKQPSLPSAGRLQGSDEYFSRDTAESVVLLSFLLAGLLLAFTPCMLPMYPVLAAIIAGKDRGRWRGAHLSVVYVAGMASGLALVGVAAAYGGAAVISNVQGPALSFASAALFVVFALASLGVITMTMPGFVASLGSRAGGAGAPGVFFMGMGSLLVLGPCTTAPMAGALLYIAGTGDVWLGGFSLFALGVGQGLPLIAVGTLGGQIMPHPGPFMDAVRAAMGVSLLGAAILVTTPFVPSEAVVAAWGSLLVVAGVVFGASGNSGVLASPARKFANSLAVLPLLFGTVLIIGAAAGGTDPLRPLAPFVATGTSEASKAVPMPEITAANGYDRFRGAARPGYLVVSADWCRTCAVIKRDVLSAGDVQKALSRFTGAQLDVTTSDDATHSVLRDLAVAGPPTVLFFGKTGEEIPGLRLTGEFSKEEMLRRLDLLGSDT